MISSIMLSGHPKILCRSGSQHATEAHLYNQNHVLEIISVKK